MFGRPNAFEESFDNRTVNEPVGSVFGAQLMVSKDLPQFNRLVCVNIPLRQLGRCFMNNICRFIFTSWPTDSPSGCIALKSKAVSAFVATIFLCAMLVAGTEVAQAQTPSVDGQWTTPFPLPLIGIHSAMLPTGKVLLFSAEHGVPGIHGWLLDPATLALKNIQPPAGWNPDCAGHSFLADGRLLVVGGTLQFNPLLGSKKAFIFDSFAENWVQIDDMARGRWYPTNITLGDGRVLTMSGINDTNGALNPDIEIWDPNTSNWSLLGQRTMPDYPYLHLLPNGLVFRSGPDSQTETFNPATGQWNFVDGTNFSARYEAPSVILPKTPNRIMLIGGYNENTGGTPTSSAEIIDFSQSTPTWTATTSMAFSRRDHNAVLLPDGTVFVVGGRSNSGGTAHPILTPEIFSPASGTWDQVAPHQVERRYHSTAILLPDARVLAAGGDFQPSGEIYSPPYLFRGPRPVLSSSPDIISYGGTFNIEFSSLTTTNTLALVRLSSVTHSVNMDQRYVLLAENIAPGASISIPAPISANLAPPGYYMLFVISADGVPSVSTMVQVLPAIPGDFNSNGVVDAADYVTWRKNVGTPDSYNTWRANFGNRLGTSASAADSDESLTSPVPEPAGVSSLILAGFICLTRRGRVWPKNALLSSTPRIQTHGRPSFSSPESLRSASSRCAWV